MKNTFLGFFFLVCVIVLSFSGCGKQEQAAAPPAAAPASVQKPDAAASSAALVPSELKGEGMIVGKVYYRGPAVSAAALDMGADPVCAERSSGAVSEELLVNSDGALRNAFVYINGGLPAGAVYPQPDSPAVLDQNGCRYSPRVVGVRVNQPLQILNSDPTLHNVHGLFKNSPEFNLGMPVQGMKTQKKFSTPEIMARVKCDVHPWMSAYIGVVEHPFFAVTGEDGSFEFKGLPAGSYSVQIWHEKLGVQNIPVEVPEKGAAEIIANYSG